MHGGDGILVQKAKNKKGVWSKIRIGNEVIEQRERDLVSIRDCLAKFKRAHVYVMTGRKERKIENPAFGNVDDFLNQKKEIAIEMPTVDITDGLKQIQDTKKRQEVLLDLIGNHLDQITTIANEIGTSLDDQVRMLDSMDKDVEKYTNQVNGLNTSLDKTISAIGGGTKLIMFGCVLIVIIAVVGIMYLVISSMVTSK
jgi:hypothetical protein